MNEPDQLVTEARFLADAIREQLAAEGIDHLVPGMEAIVGELDAAPDELSFAEALERAESMYKSMAVGPASLTDVVLWREGDPDATTRINEQYEQLRRRLREVLVDRRRGEDVAPGT